MSSNEKDVSIYNQKDVHPFCHGNGSSQTYDHCYPSHEPYKEGQSYCRYCFHEKQCIRKVNLSIGLKLCSCVQSLCINLCFISFKMIVPHLSEEQSL